MCLICHLFLFEVFAQETTTKLSFTHDNDLYFLTDKYYSAGNYISFAKKLKNKNKSQQILSFSFGQKIYTPKRKKLPDTTRFDRPFAGWLFLEAELIESTENDIWSAQLEVGLTGSQSLAGKTQRSYHKLIDEQIPSWYLQIPNDFLSNLSARYQKGFFGNRLISQSSLKLGTKDIFIQNGVELFWGSHMKFNQNSYTGIASHQSKEWFVNIGSYYRYVFHNTFIEGHIFQSIAVFTKEITNHLFLLKLKGFYRWKNNSIEMIYHFNTKENAGARTHSYLGITLSKYF